MVAFSGVGKFLILAGVFLILFGLLFIFWERIPFLGKLPGDLMIQRGSFRLFIPVVTCIIISLVLTILVNILLRLFR
ncbi:MAG: DUF2905 domain-containing protein [Dehalococcoidia bacterium]